jgi:TatD DNase family protein
MATSTHTGAGAPIIDTHAHLDFGDYDEDREEVIARAWSAGLVGIITVGTEPGDWAETLSIARGHERVHAALGVHPNSADQTNPDTLAELARLCKDASNKVVALGETGLDYYRQYVAHDKQQESFKAHLELARELDLPVIIHNRDAHDDVLDILRRDGVGTRGVMHSFSGDLDFARACIELGYMVSLSGPVSFKKAADKHLVAQTISLEHLLVETDCPFLTPEPYRGRRNEPLFVMYTAKAIAQLRETSYVEVARATTANARRLFRID